MGISVGSIVGLRVGAVGMISRVLLALKNVYKRCNNKMGTIAITILTICTVVYANYWIIILDRWKQVVVLFARLVSECSAN